jgi:hypothetical protein
MNSDCHEHSMTRRVNIGVVVRKSVKTERLPQFNQCVTRYDRYIENLFSAHYIPEDAFNGISIAG